MLLRAVPQSCESGLGPEGVERRCCNLLPFKMLTVLVSQKLTVVHRAHPQLLTGRTPASSPTLG